MSDSDEENEIIEPTETKQVAIAVQQGQRRRVMKGMAYNTDEKHGYIYLVRTREFKSTNRQIYKVGRTSQCPDTRITRLHKYTKGSEIYLILQCHVNDVGLIEKEILEQLIKIGLNFESPNVELFSAIRPDSQDGFTSIGAKGCFMSHLEI